MSYFIASSIVLTKNEIILTGGDNNVVPRNVHHLSFPNTVQHWREFIKQDLLGGCIRPIASANDYFWWWIMRSPIWNGLTYDNITDEQCDNVAAMIQDEWKKRRYNKRYSLAINGSDKYLLYKHGMYYSACQPPLMSLYKAKYLEQKATRIKVTIVRL